MSETKTAREPVLIAGAGPVGMTLALALAGHGVQSVLVDRRGGEPHIGSRSICVARATLEVLERVAGCGRQMAEEGVSWTLGRTYFRDREIFQIRFPAVGRETFPPFVNLGQQRVEEILIERMANEPLIEMRWEHVVEGLEEDGESVTLRAMGPDGPVEIRGSYLVGADGARSRVREFAGIDFAGHSHEDRFLIVDLRADLPFPDERRFYFDHPKNPGRQVLIHPQPDSVWRIDWQVPSNVDLEEEERTGKLHERIRAMIGDAPYEIVWKSLYTFHQRRASKFRSGRVLLAGDAAHVFAPFGARGMNSGVQDAENLAWKLWLVWSGLAPDALLDTYDLERRAAADHNLIVTDATRGTAPSAGLTLTLPGAPPGIPSSPDGPTSSSRDSAPNATLGWPRWRRTRGGWCVRRTMFVSAGPRRAAHGESAYARAASAATDAFAARYAARTGEGNFMHELTLATISPWSISSRSAYLPASCSASWGGRPTPRDPGPVTDAPADGVSGAYPPLARVCENGRK